MTIPLDDSRVTSSRPGIVLKGTVNPGFEGNDSGNRLRIVNSTVSSSRTSSSIDSDWFTTDNDGYLTFLGLENDTSPDDMLLFLDENVNPGGTFPGSGAGPSFTDDGWDSLYLFVFYGTAHAAWELSRLQPLITTGTAFSYVFDNHIATAGTHNSQTLRNNIDADSSVIVMLVDKTHPAIDVANAQFIPILIEFDDIEPRVLDAGGMVTVTGTFEHLEDLTTTITASASLGTITNLSQDNTDGTWTFDWTAPSGEQEARDRVVTLTVTGTDSNGDDVPVEDEVIIRGLPFSPVHDPARDFNIQNDISGVNSLYGIWADPDNDLLFVIDADGSDSGVALGSRDARVKAFNWASKTRVDGNDVLLTSQNSTNREPRGVVGDDTHLWVSDRSRVGPQGYRRSDGEDVPSEDYSASTSLRGAGITANDTYLWELYRPSNLSYVSIRVYDVDDQGYNSGESWDTDGLSQYGIANAGGLHVDEDTLWVVDTDERIVRAFDHTDEGPTPRQDFALIADNANPWGIWGDATHFYVTDTQLQKVFAYEWNVFEVSLPDVDDIDLETGRPVDFVLPEGTTRGFSNEVSTYEVSGLPSGLAFDSGERRVTGTAGSSPGSATFTYTATDTANNSDSVTVRLVTWRARPTLYPWSFKQTPTAQQFNDHISDFIDYYAGRDGVFRPYQSYRLPEFTPYSIIVLNADGDMTQLDPGIAGQVLTGQGTSALPEWADYSGDDFEVESWRIDRFDEDDSDWSSETSRILTRDHSLGRIPRQFGWCFEKVTSGESEETGFRENARVFFPFGVESIGAGGLGVCSSPIVGVLNGCCLPGGALARPDRDKRPFGGLRVSSPGERRKGFREE